MGRFSKNFYVGAATAAHQVEGNNIHSDYWAMEHMKYTNFNEPSLAAVDHYHRYEEDIRLLAQAGLNTYRFSIEWARIEPEQGKFDEAELQHYRKVLLCCRENGVEPVVTMMHFTSPLWLIQNGGWESEETIEAFAGYCRHVTETLGDLMHYVVTINEANMGLQVAAIAERYKRQMMARMQQAGAGQAAADAKKQTGAGQAAAARQQTEGVAQVGMNFAAMMEQQKQQKAEQAELFGTPDPQVFVSGRTREGDLLVMRAHRAAREAMKEVCPALQIGLSLSLHDIQAVEGGEEAAAREWEEEFSHYLLYIKEDDFFGLQNYTRSLIGPGGICPVPEGAETTQMDYEFYPQALEHVIRRVHGEFESIGVKNMPIMVTENGIATEEDQRRIAFIDAATKGVAACLADGIPVIGYCYWSLLDNFEWQKGFSMKFGLVSVDRTTMQRTKKASLEFLGGL